jgi:uncharacterized protein (TIGR02757 family)
MVDPEIKALLDEKLHEFNRPDFISADPVSIPHRYTRKEDIEISGLLAATISWGRRDLIVRAAGKMMDFLDDAPFEFVMQAKSKELKRLETFVYRTFQGPDLQSMVLGLRRIYSEEGGLENVMQLDERSAGYGARNRSLSKCDVGHQRLHGTNRQTHRRSKFGIKCQKAEYVSPMDGAQGRRWRGLWYLEQHAP